jgi:hypothetical protein
MRDLDVIDAKLRLVAALRRAARERGGSPPSIGFADELLDERCALARLTFERGVSAFIAKDR